MLRSSFSPHTMTVMSHSKGKSVFIGKTQKDGEKESIHSGHFMVSEFEADDPDDDDQVAVPVPEEETEAKTVTPQPGTIAQISKYNEKPKIKTRHPVSIETSLSKLFQCMSLAYRQKLTSPKWNRFKGIRLRWKDKIRLNNVIWRCWHMQFVNKKRTLVCQFASPLDIYTHNKPEAVVMEGKYWKRRLHAVTAEYKKWRMFYRNKLLGNKDPSEMLFDLESVDWAGNQNTMMVDEDYMEFMADTLFTTISANQPFAFPDTREIARGAGLADFIQPSLVQLQPNLDDFMDLEPLQAMLQSRLEAEGSYVGGEASKQPMFFTGGEVVSPEWGPIPFQASTAAVSYQPPPPPPPPPLLNRPPITTTTNTFPLFKVNKVKDPCNVLSKSGPQLLPPSSSVVTLAELQQPSVDQNPLLNQILSGTVSGFGEFPLDQSKQMQTKPNADLSSVSFLHSSKLNQIRLANPNFLFQQESCSGSLSKEGEVFHPSSSVAQAVISGTSLIMPPLPSPVPPPPPMGNISVCGTPPCTSPTSPTNSESLSPTNLGSPVSSPSPNKNIPPYKGQRRVFHTNAEQKRRCNIKNGFDTLHSLLPQINQTTNPKVSKAALLQKGAEYIQQLRNERAQLDQEIESLKKQVDYLNTAISNCQEKLPATGAPISKQKTGKMVELFRQLVRRRTYENWKFWILSLICEPLLVSFADSVSTASLDELYNSTLQWVDQHCSLVDLRPVVLNALRRLCTTTEVLSDPVRLPVEARDAVDASTDS